MGNCCTYLQKPRNTSKRYDKAENALNEQQIAKTTPSPTIPAAVASKEPGNTPLPIPVAAISSESRPVISRAMSRSQPTPSAANVILPPIVPIIFTPMDKSVIGRMSDMKAFNFETIAEVPRRILYFIIPFYNPLGAKRRKEILTDTMHKLTALAKIMAEDDTCLDTLEIVVSQLVYTGQVALSFNSNDLTFRTENTNVLWSKENLINLAVRDILSKNKEAEFFAFADPDIKFDNPIMFSKTVDLLEANQMQMVQMFSHAVFTGTQEVVKSFAYEFQLKSGDKSKSFTSSNNAGFAWALHRATFRAVGGLIDRAMGSAEKHMAMGLINRAIGSVPPELQQTEYGKIAIEWQTNVQNAKIKLSHVDGKIYLDGNAETNQIKDSEKWDILIKNDFQPRRDLIVNDIGLLVWSLQANPNLLKETRDFFKEVKDDPAPKDNIKAKAIGTDDASDLAIANSIPHRVKVDNKLDAVQEASEIHHEVIDRNQ